MKFFYVISNNYKYQSHFAFLDDAKQYINEKKLVRPFLNIKERVYKYIDNNLIEASSDETNNFMRQARLIIYAQGDHR